MSFVALSAHIEKSHPHLMSSFLDGWKCLPSDLQSSWLPSSVNTPTEVVNRVAFNSSPKWLSWAHWVYKEQERDQFRSRSYRYSRRKSIQRNELIRLVVDEMPHEGAFLDIPPAPEGDPESKLSFGQSEMKNGLAEELIHDFFVHVRLRSAEWLKNRILRDGVMFMKPLREKKAIVKISQNILTGGENDSDWEEEDSDD